MPLQCAPFFAQAAVGIFRSFGQLYAEGMIESSAERAGFAVSELLAAIGKVQNLCQREERLFLGAELLNDLGQILGMAFCAGDLLGENSVLRVQFAGSGLGLIESLECLLSLRGLAEFFLRGIPERFVFGERLSVEKRREDGLRSEDGALQLGSLGIVLLACAPGARECKFEVFERAAFLLDVFFGGFSAFDLGAQSGLCVSKFFAPVKKRPVGSVLGEPFGKGLVFSKMAGGEFAGALQRRLG